VIPFSVLDLSPVTEGGTVAQSFRNTLDLAQHAERWGYRRFWLAEHHGMPGVASAATSVVIGYVANGTSTIRVGAGGIMLPNHPPLVIAEQFGTLESLYPGRIDLGLGRAPGTDAKTSRALRRKLEMDVEEFPQDVTELMNYFRAASDDRGNERSNDRGGERGESREERRAVRAVPGAGLNIPVWILGSSLFGATFAAEFGLPFAFASHFAPAQMMAAIEIYRNRFKPSEQLARPYVMLGFNVFAADTDEEGEYLASSMQQMFVSLRTGNPGRIRPPVRGYYESLPSAHQDILEQVLSCSAIGSPETVRQSIESFIAATKADELMITSQIYDHPARLRSFEIAAEVAREATAGIRR
jgi:luciferase family oxidoreductase group 1